MNAVQRRESGSGAEIATFLRAFLHVARVADKAGVPSARTHMLGACGALSEPASFVRSVEPSLVLDELDAANVEVAQALVPLLLRDTLVHDGQPGAHHHRGTQCDRTL